MKNRDQIDAYYREIAFGETIEKDSNGIPVKPINRNDVHVRIKESGQILLLGDVNLKNLVRTDPTNRIVIHMNLTDFTDDPVIVNTPAQHSHDFLDSDFESSEEFENVPQNDGGDNIDTDSTYASAESADLDIPPDPVIPADQAEKYYEYVKNAIVHCLLHSGSMKIVTKNLTRQMFDKVNSLILNR